MKLPQNNTLVEGSNNNGSSFRIGNVGFILDILRNKLYSNIPESICREYASNARDAHREINTPDLPIEITFPNAFDGNLIIRDFGIGISPDRMENVFLAYGNSTKRNDNIQIGGFGLGAKVFFGYASQFTIITITKEIKNNKELNIKRTYLAFIDRSQEGKAPLVSEEETEEHTGTSIVLPIDEKDYQAFIIGTLKSTQYWTIRPILHGINPTPEWPQTVGSLLTEGDGWKVYNKTPTKYNAFSVPITNEALVIIDGIQYKIDRTFIDYKYQWMLQNNLHLFFNIGELTLSASRENLQYDDNTTKLINNKIKSVHKELSEKVSEIIESKDSYLEAVQFYEFMNTHFHIILNKDVYKWRGYKIVGSRIDINAHVLSRMKIQICDYTKHRSYSGKISIKLYRNTTITLNDNTEYYYNDIDPEKTFRKKNLKALESHSLIQIINYKKDKTYDDFVTDLKTEFTNQNAMYMHTDNSFIFDLIKPKMLSSVIEDKYVAGPRVPKVKVPQSTKISVHKYFKSSGYKLRDYFIGVNIEPDTEGCYVETNFKHNKLNTKNWDFSYSDLNSIKQLIGDINIFSIKEKDISKLTNLKPLKEILEEKYNESVDEDYYKAVAMNSVIEDYSGDYYNIFSHIGNLKNLLKEKNKILNQKSLILKYCEYIELENKLPINFIEKLEKYLNQTNNLEMHVKNVNKLLREIKTRYELLPRLYNAETQEIINYINLIDSNYKEPKTLKIAGK